MAKRKAASVPPGSNWLALQKSLPSDGKTASKSKGPKRATTSSASLAFPRGETSTPTTSTRPSAARSVIQEDGADDATKEVKQLRKLVLGVGIAGEDLVGEPGRYLALDCEMVGVGEGGKESSLARASIVDFHGRIVLDEFVQQPKPFRDIQSRVAELLAPADRILVGHALHNDLAALLLTHPASRTRDTQIYAGKKPAPRSIKGKQNADTLDAASSSPKTLWEKYRSPRIGLKILIKGELGVDIQTGEHNSVTDARAAMAIYRLHKRAWDASLPPSYLRRSAPQPTAGKHNSEEEIDSGTEAQGRAKRKRSTSASESFPGGGRRGVSSGLSTVIRGSARNDIKAGLHGTKMVAGTKDRQPSHVGRAKWWQSLGDAGGSSGSKGKLHLS